MERSRSSLRCSLFDWIFTRIHHSGMDGKEMRLWRRRGEQFSLVSFQGRKDMNHSLLKRRSPLEVAKASPHVLCRAVTSALLVSWSKWWINCWHRFFVSTLHLELASSISTPNWIFIREDKRTTGDCQNGNTHESSTCLAFSSVYCQRLAPWIIGQTKDWKGAPFSP